MDDVDYELLDAQWQTGCDADEQFERAWHRIQLEDERRRERGRLVAMLARWVGGGILAAVALGLVVALAMWIGGWL